MSDHPHAPPRWCTCGHGHRATPWHCQCGGWKPSASVACEVCLGQPAHELQRRVNERRRYREKQQAEERRHQEDMEAAAKEMEAAAGALASYWRACREAEDAAARELASYWRVRGMTAA